MWVFCLLLGLAFAPDENDHKEGGLPFGDFSDHKAKDLPSVDYYDHRARGLPVSINWMGYTKALEVAKTTGKPTLVLFTKTWCGACKNLKSNLLKLEEDFKKASEKFQMVSIEEDSETPTDERNFTPDGGYIPRVFFLDPEGNIDSSITGGNSQYKHFFSSAESLILAMGRFAHTIETAQKETKKVDL